MCKFCDSKKEKNVLLYDNHNSMNIHYGQYQGVHVNASLTLKGNMLILNGSGNYRSRSDCYYEDQGLDCDGEFSKNASDEYIKIEYCPFCGKKAIKRQAAGIWKCRGCRRAIAGGAWEFVTTAATTAKTTINRLKKNLESRKKPEKEIDEDEEEEPKQKKGQKDKEEKKEKKGKKENKDNKPKKEGKAKASKKK